jgi:hypothetical protein
LPIAKACINEHGGHRSNRFDNALRGGASLKDLLVAFAIATGLCATGALADAPPEKPAEAAPQEAAPAPKKKVKKKKKVHKAHKFHADHKVAEAPPPPAPEPPPPPAPEPLPPTPEPAPVVHIHKHDDSGFYIGGGAGSFMMDIVGLNVNGVGGTARLRGTEFGGYGNVGYNFNRNVAVELRAGTIGTERQLLEGGPLLGVPGSVPFTFVADTDAFYSGFLKGTLPIGDEFGIYGLIGATHYVVDLAADIGPLSYRDDFNDGDLSYGVGIEGRLGRDVTLGAEYVRYIDDSDGGVAVELDGLVGRVQFQF